VNETASAAPEGEDEPVAAGPASLVTTVTGNLYLVFGSIVFATLTCLFGWIPLPHHSRAFFPIVRWWSKLLLWSGGVRLRAEHEVPLDPDGTYVFLVNHQSLFDIPVLLASLPVAAHFMAKRELFRIPLFGWGLHVGGFIPVERGTKSAGESFRAGIERLKRGGSVLLFPEETRSPDGRLLPFKRGGFLLAQKAAAQVVPVGIRGTIGIRQRNSLRIHPGQAVVRYGAPIDSRAALRSSGGDEKPTSLLQTVRERIAELAGVEALPQTVKGDTP
jgi:1-acyl-sn-glycerol-3-phosphate acyltransferase